MKVLHLINTLSAGGAELHLLTLCRYLKRQGVEVMVACLREQVKDGSRSLGPDFEQEGIRVVRLQAESRYDLRFVLALAALLKEEQPALLHTHLPRADLAGAWVRLRYPSLACAWVCSVHDIYTKAWGGRWTLPIFNYVWRRADAVVAISHAVKEWLERERQVPPDKVTVIHYGIEPERFAQPHTDLRARWGLDGRALVGSIGRLEPRKGHECLIQAMPIVLRQVPDTALLIAGPDTWEYSAVLRPLIAKLGLDSQVRLVGFQGDVPSFLHALDVFAFASRSEGFGQVVIEAMAAGTPVVTSRIPPLTEIMVDGETGLLVEPDDPRAFAQAIAWLLQHPEEAQRMGKQGQERIQSHFLAGRMAEETLALYHRVLRAV
ncbi:MAG: glycosyltransferase family 4 protein [Candidatus Binatia bacterium]